ncbi:hypothetical protein VTJ83DRAFT_4211 [Remersonia thermophila]|uniref:Non-structural maintenance of chromosomes element 1 homolog n=1 Tax=Remersonia thermophila TaxID=72144 RepID=A0ABR4D988_9PEZI
MADDWEPPLPPGYNDAHRAFLQAFMARGTLTFREGRKLLAAIASASNAGRDGDSDGEGEGEGHGHGHGPVNPDSITMADFESWVRTVREAVEPLDFDVRNTRDQVRGERVWAFVNAHSDPVTQLGTARTPDEVAYVKRLLDAMFDQHNTPRMEVMAVDEGQALRASRPRGRESQAGGDADAGEEGTQAPAAARPLKHSEVLALLASLVAEGWLRKSQDGFYDLTPRALMELWPWLVETYNDPEPADGDWQRIKFCEACKEIVTHGQRCDNLDCTVRLHDICDEAFWRTRSARTCPKCGTPWEGNHFVGERAVTTRAGFQRGRGARRRTEAAQNDEEPVDEEEEEGA